MAKIIALIIIWTTFVICIAIMRKINPEDKVYPIYAVTVSIIFTTLLAVL